MRSHSRVGAEDRSWAVLALVGCAMVTLATGEWLTFDERIEGGSGPRAVVAALLFGTALLLAVVHPKSRRVLGGTLVVLVLALVVASQFDGFRFVWRPGDPELFTLKVLLAVLGMGLLAPAHLAPGVASSTDLEPTQRARSSPSLSGRTRALLWLLTAGFMGALGHNLDGWSGVGYAVVVVVVARFAVRVVRSRRRGSAQ